VSDETPTPAPADAPKAEVPAPAAKPAPPPPKPPADPAFLAEVDALLGAGAAADHQGGLPAWRVGAAAVLETCRRVRAAGYDFLMFVSAVDRPAEGKLDVLYALGRYGEARQIALLAEIDREQPEIDSVVEVWAGAEWHERETYDMFGVVFRGHPFLRRILLDEDWPGHPLRKDYVDTLHDVVKRPT
jgi:NADH-quinone oxidoreductase subunit C